MPNSQRIAFVLFLFAAATLAQSQQASISGGVTDSSGAALVGARVIASNIATNVATVAVTPVLANAFYLRVATLVGNWQCVPVRRDR